MLMAWSPTRLVVSFRGTASWTNVWADLQVLPFPPPLHACLCRPAGGAPGLATGATGDCSQQGPSFEFSTVVVLTSESRARVCIPH